MTDAGRARKVQQARLISMGMIVFVSVRCHGFFCGGSHTRHGLPVPLHVVPLPCCGQCMRAQWWSLEMRIHCLRMPSPTVSDRGPPLHNRELVLLLVLSSSLSLVRPRDVRRMREVLVVVWEVEFQKRRRMVRQWFGRHEGRVTDDMHVFWRRRRCGVRIHN